MPQESAFGDYWRERLKESFVKARVKAETILFLLFLSGGLVLLCKPSFPIDRSVWWVGFGFFVLIFLVELCFVSPYRHAQQQYQDHRDEITSLNNASKAARNPK